MEKYSEITSKKAEHFIIDTFNTINKGKPYKMKTVTTIYKHHNEIFKDEDRYPIDAPYRKFYDELSEKGGYVDKHGLDKIFHRTKDSFYYYFEFSNAPIGKQENTFNFIVHDWPPEEKLKADVTKRYIPMLYSMLTGSYICWEKSEVTFNKTRNNDTTKALLVFGYTDQSNDEYLDFHWMASFELDDSIKNNNGVKNIAKEIGEKKKDDIIFLIRGVLFSTLDKKIIEFYNDKKRLELIHHLIKDHQHTIKNFGFKSLLEVLYRKMKLDKYNNGLMIIEKLEKLDLLRDVISDSLYNFNNSEEPLLKLKGINTYTAILDLIYDSTSDEKKDILKYNESINTHPLNIIEDVDLNDVLTLLLNLFSNCNNHSRGDFTIKLYPNDSSLCILFTNKGDIPKQFLDLLNGEGNYNKNYKGMYFIKKALENLKHIKIICRNESGLTFIQLIIDKKI